MAMLFDRLDKTVIRMIEECTMKQMCYFQSSWIQKVFKMIHYFGMNAFS